jgi:hypothetical protein
LISSLKKFAKITSFTHAFIPVSAVVGTTEGMPGVLVDLIGKFVATPVINLQLDF